MHFVRTIALAATTLLTVGHLTTAAAQSAEPSSTGKGIVGGTLLGAEAVLLTEAALDVSPNWLYYVGGGAGAIGGGIAGYYLEDALSPKGNMILMASGMLLAIPTTVAVLSATAYEQTAEYTQDAAPSDEPRADPIGIDAAAGASTGTTQAPGAPAPAGSSTAPATTAPSPEAAPAATPPAGAPTSHRVRRAPTRRGISDSLVAMDDHSRLHLGLPAVEVRPMYSRVELQRFGVEQRSELRIPLLRVAF